MSNPDFLKGYAMALADMNRKFDRPTIVADLMKGHGFTLTGFRNAGVDEYDMDAIRKAFDHAAPPTPKGER